MNSTYLWVGIGHDLRLLYDWVMGQGKRPDFLYDGVLPTSPLTPVASASQANPPSPLHRGEGMGA